MARKPRALIEGGIYHITSRGNERRAIFRDDRDRLRFLDNLADSAAAHQVRIYLYCLMPNHFHLVVQAHVAAELAKNMHWLLSTHARRFRSKWEGAGHVWQGRFKSFPVQSDHHLITLLRYVEGNPVRAGMVASCREWLWSSVREREGEHYLGLLAMLPVDLPSEWASFVDQPLKAEEVVLKDEAQRAWSWFQVHVRESIYGELHTTQIITVNGIDYKIMAKKDYFLNGYREYHAILNYQESV